MCIYRLTQCHFPGPVSCPLCLLVQFPRPNTLQGCLVSPSPQQSFATGNNWAPGPCPLTAQAGIAIAEYIHSLQTFLALHQWALLTLNANTCLSPRSKVAAPTISLILAHPSAVHPQHSSLGLCFQRRKWNHSLFPIILSKPSQCGRNLPGGPFLVLPLCPCWSVATGSHCP